jgi:hypothetical protein
MRCEPTGRVDAPDGTLREAIQNAEPIGLPRRIRFFAVTIYLTQNSTLYLT